MKDGIHPTTYPKAKITCTSCGAVYQIPTTTESLSVEICRGCHPIYTGKKQQEAKGGRVERFKKRAAKSKGKK